MMKFFGRAGWREWLTAQVVVPYGAKTLIVNLLLADGERPSAYGW